MGNAKVSYRSGRVGVGFGGAISGTIVKGGGGVIVGRAEGGMIRGCPSNYVNSSAIGTGCVKRLVDHCGRCGRCRIKGNRMGCTMFTDRLGGHCGVTPAEALCGLRVGGFSRLTDCVRVEVSKAGLTGVGKGRRGGCSAFRRFRGKRGWGGRLLVASSVSDLVCLFLVI